MFLRDFIYFSKGERQGLIVILALIIIAGILLIINQKNKDDVVSEETVVISTVNITDTAALSERQQEVTSGSEMPVKTNVPKEERRETVKERVARMTSNRPNYPRAEKFAEGTVTELNGADTTVLKKVPGIGSSFAKRIVSYRNLLGGYYSVTQLSEVYGIDEEKYNSLAHWFTVDPSLIRKLNVNTCPFDSLNRHPYVNYNQAKVISQLRRQKGKLTGWENLELLDEFTESDRIKLKYYLSFE